MKNPNSPDGIIPSTVMKGSLFLHYNCPPNVWKIVDVSFSKGSVHSSHSHCFSITLFSLPRIGRPFLQWKHFFFY